MRCAGNLPLSRRGLLAGAALTLTASRLAGAQPAPALLKPRLARERLEAALSRIFDTGGEGSRACITVYGQTARSAADAADARAQAGIALGPLDGAIVSIKDSVRRGGRSHPGRLGSAGRCGAGHRGRGGGAAAARRRLMHHRQDQHGGIRLYRSRPQSAFRHPRQSGRPCPHSGRFILGRRGRCRGPDVRDRDRLRYRRLGASSGGAVRRRRLQAVAPAGADRGCVSALLYVRLDRSAGPHGRGLRRGRRGDGRRGSRGD